jgi:hypothetical protein
MSVARSSFWRVRGTQEVAFGEPRPALSWSRLSAYSHCGYQYKLQNIDKLPQVPQGNFLGGRAIHEAIEESERQGWWKDSDSAARGGVLERFFLAAFDAELIEAHDSADYPIRWGGRKTRNYPGGEDAKWWQTSGPMMLRRYVSLRQADAELGHEMEHIEGFVGANLPSGTYVRGYIDGYLSGDTIRDWKTGKPGGAQRAQLGTYGWAMRSTMDKEVRYGQFVYLRAQDSARMVETFDLEPWIAMVEWMFTELEKGLAAEVYLPQPSNMCIACSVRPHCQVGQQYVEKEVNDG